MPTCFCAVSGCPGGPKAAFSRNNRDHHPILEPAPFTVWPVKEKFADPWPKGKMPVLYNIVDSEFHSVPRHDRFPFPPILVIVKCLL